MLSRLNKLKNNNFLHKIKKALAVLKGFYEKAKGTALVQAPAGPPPPAGFKSYENNAAGGGVIAMITAIINDAKAMEAEAIHDEEDAQVKSMTSL